MIYLDYGATTPIDQEVLEAYIRTSKNFFANTSSLHKLGQESNYMYQLAVDEIKRILQVPSHNIVFTSNATEANNLAILGLVGSKRGKIISTKIEHPSVFEVIRHLESTHEVVYLDVLENGQIDLAQLEHELNKDTILVSIMWVNNILGTVQNIKEVIKLVKNYPKAKLHVDAVQGLCKVEPDFSFADLDAFTFSSHKIYGPKGIGGLFYKDSIELEKVLYGSSAQHSVKPGTFDLSLIVATTKAFQIYMKQTASHATYVKELFLYLYQELSKSSKIQINTPTTNISYYVLNFSIDVVGETLVHHLEEDDIFISTGSACSSKLRKPEKTVYALTKDVERSLKSVRVSLSHLTTKNELKQFLESLKKIW